MYMIFCGLSRLFFVELVASAFCACCTAAARCLQIAATLPVLWKCIHFSGRWDVIGCSTECLSGQPSPALVRDSFASNKQAGTAPQRLAMPVCRVTAQIQGPSHIGTHNAKPHPGSPWAQKAAFIRDKYQVRKYVRVMDTDEACLLMWQAALAVCSWCMPLCQAPRPLVTPLLHSLLIPDRFYTIRWPLAHTLHSSVVQDNLQQFQVAIAAGASLADHGQAPLPQVECVAQQASARVTSSATESGVPQPANIQNARGSTDGSGQLSEETCSSKLTVLHLACAKQSIALVEFIWQVLLRAG